MINFVNYFTATFVLLSSTVVPTFAIGHGTDEETIPSLQTLATKALIEAFPHVAPGKSPPQYSCLKKELAELYQNILELGIHTPEVLELIPLYIRNYLYTYIQGNLASDENHNDNSISGGRKPNLSQKIATTIELTMNSQLELKSVYLTPPKSNSRNNLWQIDYYDSQINSTIILALGSLENISRTPLGYHNIHFECISSRKAWARVGLGCLRGSFLEGVQINEGLSLKGLSELFPESKAGVPQSWKHLKRLSFFNKSLSPQGAEQVAKTGVIFPNLEYLTVQRCDLRSVHGTFFQSLLRQSPALHSICTINCLSSPEMVSSLLGAKNGSKLKTIKLISSPIRMEAAESFIKNTGLPNLQSLLFYGHEMDDEVINTLFSNESTIFKSITELTLQHCPITIQPLAANSSLINLKSLSLENSSLGAKDLAILFSSESLAGSLEVLDLSLNPLGRKAGAILGSNLLKFPKLHSLMISTCKLNNKGAIDLFSRPGVSCIRLLEISDNGIQGSDAFQTIACSKYVKNLRTLNISYNKQTLEDLKILLLSTQFENMGVLYAYGSINNAEIQSLQQELADQNIRVPFQLDY